MIHTGSDQVSKSGCIGGRKQQQDDTQSKDIIMFKDITVSRRHFEVIVKPRLFFILYICVRMYVCMFMYVYVCVCMCMYVCMYVESDILLVYNFLL